MDNMKLKSCYISTSLKISMFEFYLKLQILCYESF